MESSYDIVIFTDDYGRHLSSSHHLIKRFLSQHRVLWINTVGLRTPRFSLYDFFRGLQKIKESFHPLKQREPQLWVYSLFSLPWNHISLIRKANRFLGIKRLKGVLKQLGFSNVVCMTTVPNACDWIGELGEKLIIYYCTDDYSEWPGAEKQLILKMEEKILKKMDLFVPVSERLLEIKDRQGKPYLLLTHGVDVDHFKKAWSHSHPSPRKFSSPCIGYFGLVDERLDFDLIRSLIQSRPQWSWVFLGPIQTLPKDLFLYSNCVFMPPLPYEDLPETLCCFDILLLPYKNNRLIQASNPLKFRECLATGKPVVCYDMPWAQDYREVVTLCQNLEEFLFALDQIVAGKRNVYAERQWDKIKHESWEIKANTLAQKITELLGAQ